MTKKTLIKKIISAVIVAIIALAFFLYARSFFQISFTDYDGNPVSRLQVIHPLEIIFTLFCFSLIAFFVLWNIVKSKRVYFLLILPGLSLFAGIGLVLYLNNRMARETAEWIQRGEEIAQQEAREEELRVARLQQISAAKYEQSIAWLQENVAYPRGFYINPQEIVILTIEDNFPVLQLIDIVDGEIIEKTKTPFRRFYDPGGRYVVFQEENYRIFVGIDRSRSPVPQLTYQSSHNSVGSWYRFVAKTSAGTLAAEIPEEVFWRTSDSQAPYAGVYVFDDFVIQSHMRAYEFLEGEREMYSYSSITVSLEDDGFLATQSARDSEHYRFKLRLHYSGGIFVDGANGTFQDTPSETWSFSKDNHDTLEVTYYNWDTDNEARYSLTVRYVKES